jgi:hypothetical protein
LTTGDHPAVLGWQELRGGRARKPTEVVVLDHDLGRSSKTAVYRLAGAGPRGSAVIAKRSRRR